MKCTMRSSPQRSRPCSIAVAYYLSLVVTFLGVAGGSIMLRTMARTSTENHSLESMSNARIAAIICIVVGLAIGAVAGASKAKVKNGWVLHVTIAAVSVFVLGITLIVGRGTVPLVMFVLVLIILTTVLWPSSVKWFYPNSDIRLPGQRPSSPR